MPKPEREEMILRFFYERDVILPPKVLHINLREIEGATFSYRTVQRLLGELKERGYVENVDVGRGFYRITNEGVEYLKNNFEE